MASDNYAARYQRNCVSAADLFCKRRLFLTIKARRYLDIVCNEANRRLLEKLSLNTEHKKSLYLSIKAFTYMVAGGGLEPPHPKIPDFESSVSTNSTIPPICSCNAVLSAIIRDSIKTGAHYNNGLMCVNRGY